MGSRFILKPLLGGSWSDDTLDKVWEKGREIPNADPGKYRLDAAGAVIQRDQYGELTTFGWQVDHLQPEWNGGDDRLSNLRPLFHKNNNVRPKGKDDTGEKTFYRYSKNTKENTKEFMAADI